MVKKRIINNINEYIASYKFGTYEKIKVKLEFDNFEDKLIRSVNSKKALKFAIAFVTFCSVVAMAAISVPILLKKGNSPSGYVSSNEQSVIKSTGGESANSSDGRIAPITGYSFSDFDSLVSYIRDEYSVNNDGSFFLVEPQMMVKTMGHGFSISFDEISVDNEKNGVLSNPTVTEFFYIYDENLGTISDPTKDVPYYSMKFNCLFYPVEDSSIDIDDANIINISENKIQIKYDDCFAIDVYMQNLDKTNYVIDFLKNNMFRV